MITKKEQLRIKRKWKKLGIKITKELRDIIHGYIMSDGYVRNGILTVDQGEDQKRFVEWLYNKLSLLRTDSPIKEVIRIHPKTKVTSRSYRFFTRAVLQGFNRMWYPPYLDNLAGEKRLPKNINNFFNETLITVWFAGDGTKIIDSLGAKFEVTSFTAEERIKLKSLFLSKFGISTTIISSGTSRAGTPQWALKIPAEEYPKFKVLITKMDLIPSIFPNKLH